MEHMQQTTAEGYAAAATAILRGLVKDPEAKVKVIVAHVHSYGEGYTVDGSMWVQPGMMMPLIDSWPVGDLPSTNTKNTIIDFANYVNHQLDILAAPPKKRKFRHQQNLFKGGLVR
jgi:hypothetical protein